MKTVRIPGSKFAKLIVFVFLAFTFFPNGLSAQFVSGNLVVLQVGTGSSALSNASAPLFLKEYTSTGTFVQDVTIPSTGSSRITISGSAASEGAISRSENGFYLTIAGYDSDPGVASINSAAGVSRVTGYLSNDESWTRPYVIPQTSGFNSNNIRSACYDGTRAYAAGTASTASLGGVRYFDSGTTSIQVSSTVTNMRVVNIFGSQLYASAASGTNIGIIQIGSGVPTNTGNTGTLVINTGTGASPYGFFFNSTRTVCYIADDRASALGGIQKWTASSPSGPWTLAYTLSVSAGNNIGARGVTVDFSGTNPIIYATTTDNRLVKITDAGSGSAFTLLATAATNTAFRGVAFAPIANTTYTYYVDNDGDGYGSSTTFTSSSPTAPAGYAASSGDCNNNDGAINPGVVESVAQANVCDDVDNDCDLTVDEGSVAGCNNPVACNYNALATCAEGCDFSAITWYADTDGDTYGNPSSSVVACTNPGGYVLNNTDCDDTNAAINPGITESGLASNICDGIDNNCDLSIDPGRINGCTDNTATNYNASATCSDGSCTYPAGFTAGNVVVLQVGNGSALTNASTPVSLREYDATGNLIQNIPIPSSGSNRITVSGTATSEGSLARSENGLYLAIAGYDSGAGVSSINSATGVSRTLGFVNSAQTWSRPFLVPQTNAFNTNNIRSAYYDGTNAFAGGNATTATLGGVRYFDSNTNTIQVSSTVTNIRTVNVFGGQLYASAASGSNIGVLALGTGVPTNTGNTGTLLINTGTGASPYAFYFNPSRTICYIADDRATAAGGIQKWTATNPSGPWILAYTLSVSAGNNIGARGVTVDFSGANPIIYATTTDNRLVKITDTGSGSAFALLATAATNYVFRGVAFAPTATTLYTYYEDLDGDGYGTYTVISSTSSTPPAGYASVAGDCDDNNALVNPGITESIANTNVCDDLDNDCDLTIDEGSVAGCNNALACNYNPLATCNEGCDFNTLNWYLDADGDGFGLDASVLNQCTNPGGYINIGGDCDDTNAAINPSITESLLQSNICDGIDNNCDFVVDPGRVDGCTDINALNYNSGANCNNNGCVYPSGFVAGDLIISRVGAGSAALSSSSTAVFFDEYNPLTGNQSAPVYSFAIPTTGSLKLTNSGSATSNLQLNRSADGLSVVIAGLDVVAGTASVTGSTSLAINRVIGELDINLQWSRPFASSVFYSGDNFRSAAKAGNNYYGSGNSTTTGGINYFGSASAASNISNSPANTRVVKIVNNEVYFSTASNSPGIGIYKVGSGLPTSATAAVPVINMGTTAGPSPYDFDFNSSLTVCYVADDRTSSAGGIQKWVNNNGVWSLSYTISVGSSTGVRSLYVDYYSEVFPVIYAITAPLTGQSRLVRLTDSGITTPVVSTLATAPTNTAFRGVDLAPCYGQVWYRDLDNDGYGDATNSLIYCTQPLGYVSLSGDCDDTNDLVYFSAVEDCDGLDNDCDTFIDDACLNVPDNDTRAHAQVIAPTTYPSCFNNNIVTDLTNAGDSPESSITSPVTAGQDVWYRFTATTTACRIAVNSTNNDIAIELQNAVGSSLYTENDVAGVGGEILIASALVVGQDYFIAIKNVSGTSVGESAVCIQKLSGSRCNNVSNNFSSLCSAFKAAYTGASGYIYEFTEIPTTQDPVVDVFTGNTTSGSTSVTMSNVVGLAYGRQYSVRISSVYQLMDAASNMNVVTVEGVETCTLTVQAQNELNVRASDASPNVRYLNSTIGADRWICGATKYRWAITQLTPSTGLTVYVDGANGNRFLSLANVNLAYPGLLQSGATYNVEIAPVFGTIEGDFGSLDQTLVMAGSSMPIQEENEEAMLEKMDRLENEQFIYPNPNDGMGVNIVLNINKEESLLVKVLDAKGSLCQTKQVIVDGGASSIYVDFEKELVKGLYSLQVVIGDKVVTHRLVVQ